jgi:hypothetical protein
MRRTMLTTAIVVIAALALAPSAWAGGPGKWDQVTASGLSNTSQVSLVRAADGVLHVAWAGPGYSATQILERQIDFAGEVLTDAWPVVRGDTSLSDPALVALGGKLWAFYAGSFPGGQGLACSTTSGDQMLALITSANAAYAGTPSAVLGPGNEIFQTWAAGFFLSVHKGLTSAPPYDYQASLGGNGYDPNIALDHGRAGTLWVAWFSLPGPGHDQGIYASVIDPSTGGPAGSPYHLPGSSTMSAGSQQSDPMVATRVPMAARTGGTGGVYVAYPIGYPTTNGVRLWKLATDATGDPTSTSVAIAAGSAVKDDVAVAADPKGRLWVLWTQKDGSRMVVYARRSNTGATVFGAPVKVFVPAGVSSVWRLAADAQADRVDVLAHMDNASGAASWHTQLLAGLSVTFSKTALKAKTRYSLVVTVKDAGAPVAGVKVRIGTKVGKTNASGRVTLKVGPLARGSVAVTVTRTGYTTLATRLRVK